MEHGCRPLADRVPLSLCECERKAAARSATLFALEHDLGPPSTPEFGETEASCSIPKFRIDTASKRSGDINVITSFREQSPLPYPRFFTGDTYSSIIYEVW
jgi:hypothetical protein